MFRQDQHYREVAEGAVKNVDGANFILLCLFLPFLYSSPRNIMACLNRFTPVYLPLLLKLVPFIKSSPCFIQYDLKLEIQAQGYHEGYVHAGHTIES